MIARASGWHDQGGGDFKSRHVYFRPVRLRRDKNRILALTEFGSRLIARSRASATLHIRLS